MRSPRISSASPWERSAWGLAESRGAGRSAVWSPTTIARLAPATATAGKKRASAQAAIRKSVPMSFLPAEEGRRDDAVARGRDDHLHLVGELLREDLLDEERVGRHHHALAAIRSAVHFPTRSRR